MVSVEDISSSTENNGNIDDVDQISIFDAEKYFSEECNDSNSKKVTRRDEVPSPASHGRSFMAESPRATPSAPSVASSNNSRSSLLTKTTFASRKKWSAAKKWFFSRNCCCSNVKSVGVQEIITSDMNAKSVGVKEMIISDSDRRSRPIVLMDSKKSNILHADSDDQKKKDSSEILTFSRFSIKDDVDHVVEIHRVMDYTPRHQRISATGRPFINGFTFPIADVAAVAREDDAGSDASSDLFEIESFSTQALVDEADFKGERKLAAANGGESVHCRRLSGAGEEGGGEGKRKSDGMKMMSCWPENVAAGGPPAISLHVGGRPPPARRGVSQSSPPLVVAGL